MFKKSLLSLIGVGLVCASNVVCAQPSFANSQTGVYTESRDPSGQKVWFEALTRPLTKRDVGKDVELRLTPDDGSTVDCTSETLVKQTAKYAWSVTPFDYSKSGCWSGGVNLVTKVDSSMVGYPLYMDGWVFRKGSSTTSTLKAQATIGSEKSDFGVTTAKFKGTASIEMGINQDALSYPETLSKVKESGSRWVRTGVQTDWVNHTGDGTNPAYDNWTQVDTMLKESKRLGLKVDFIISGVPGNVTNQPYLAGPRNDAELAAYTKFVVRLTKHIRSLEEKGLADVDTYEIWNEENSHYFYYPTNPGMYYRLLKNAGEAIHANDPGSKVVTGGTAFVIDGVTGLLDTKFIEGIYNNVPKSAFDAVAVHAYPMYYNKSRDTSDLGHLEKYRAIMDSHGDASTELWLTETGSSTYAGGTDEETQAWFLDYAYTALKSIHNHGPMFVHTLYDLKDRDVTENNYGLLKTDGTPKKAWYEFQKISNGSLG